MTQIQLAEAVCVAQQTVAAWETERNEPQLAFFKAIARVTDSTPEWLAFGVGEGVGPKDD